MKNKEKVRKSRKNNMQTFAMKQKSSTFARRLLSGRLKKPAAPRINSCIRFIGQGVMVR